MRVSLLVAAAVFAALLSLLVAPSVAAHGDDSIDMLITDVGLPGGLNGRQVADAAQALRPGLKILFITGYAENAALNHGHIGPGMAVLTKPFAISELARRVERMLGQT